MWGVERMSKTRTHEFENLKSRISDADVELDHANAWNAEWSSLSFTIRDRLSPRSSSYVHSPPSLFCPFFLNITSSKLIHKPSMKLGDLPHPFRPWRQKRRAEMQGPLLLPEPTPGHNTDAGGVQQAETVEFVRQTVFGFGGFDGLLGEVDGGEEVH